MEDTNYKFKNIGYVVITTDTGKSHLHPINSFPIPNIYLQYIFINASHFRNKEQRNKLHWSFSPLPIV